MVSHFSWSNFIRKLRRRKNWIPFKVNIPWNDTNSKQKMPANQPGCKPKRNTFLIQHIIFQSIFLFKEITPKKSQTELKTVFNTNCYVTAFILSKTQLTGNIRVFVLFSVFPVADIISATDQWRCEKNPSFNCNWRFEHFRANCMKNFCKSKLLSL